MTISRRDTSLHSMRASTANRQRRQRSVLELPIGRRSQERSHASAPRRERVQRRSCCAGAASSALVAVVAIALLLAAVLVIVGHASSAQHASHTPWPSTSDLEDRAAQSIAHHRAVEAQIAREVEAERQAALKRAQDERRASRQSTGQRGSTKRSPSLSGSHRGSCGLDYIRAHENPVANPYGRSTNPTHFGAYQFDRDTWQSNGGNPATWGTASPEEQDAVAARTYAARGSRPWAVCG